MSLFVRLDVGFWTHRKTLRLRALIGDAAFWVPPRLWSYAAQSQPDGDFSAYLPAEIAMLVGYSGNAEEMLGALQQASFFDGLKIHGWEEHNGYHAAFSERAKNAAAIRWGREKEKKKQKEKGEEKTRDREERRGEGGKHCSTHPQAMLGASDTEAEAFKAAWNELPKPFVAIRCMSAGRTTALRARMKEPFWKTNWRQALARLPVCEFASGRNARGWVADVDFFLRPDSVAKVMEGKYDHTKGNGLPASRDPRRTHQLAQDQMPEVITPE